MIFIILQGILLFKIVADSMDNTFHNETHLLQKYLNIIKSQLCGPWNNEKLNKKDDNEMKILGSCEWV